MRVQISGSLPWTNEQTNSPWIMLARAMVADAILKNDTAWLKSTMGTMFLDTLEYSYDEIKRMLIAAKSDKSNRGKKLWKGQFRTVKEIANMEGINPQTLANRLSKGWDLETAVKRATDVKINTNLYSWRGQMLSLSQIARKENVDFQRLCSRVYRGWSLDRAIAAPACEPNGRRESCFFS